MGEPGALMLSRTAADASPRLLLPPSRASRLAIVSALP